MFRAPSRDRTDGNENDGSLAEGGVQTGLAGWSGVVVGGVVLVALIAPLFERSGYWDHWPSWSLYSPHASRVEVEIDRSAIGRLDPAMRAFVEENRGGDGWQRLAIGDWSLRSRACRSTRKPGTSWHWRRGLPPDVNWATRFWALAGRLGSLDRSAQRDLDAGEASIRRGACGFLADAMKSGFRCPSAEEYRRSDRASRRAPGATARIASELLTRSLRLSS